MGGYRLFTLPNWLQKKLIEQPKKVVAVKGNIKAIYFPEKDDINVGMWCETWKNKTPCRQNVSSLCHTLINNKVKIFEGEI